jgi:hypothetical protein
MMSCDELDCEPEESDVEDPDVVVPGVEPVDVGVGAGGVTTTVLSATVTRKLPRATLPASSVEKQLTVVVPRLKVEPEAGAQFANTDGSRLSDAEAE